MNILQWITDSAQSIPEVLRAAIAAVFATLEVLGLGPFFPGELAVLFLGASFDSVAGAALLVAAVTVGASVGDHVLYFTGRAIGPRLRKGRLVKIIGVEKWDVAIGVVERRGAWAVISTRLVPIVRSLTPIAAGVSGMPQPRFTGASLIGSATWAIVWGGTGFILRSSLSVAEAILGQSTWIVIAVLGSIVLVVVAVRAIRKRRQAGAPLLPRHVVDRWLFASIEIVATVAFVTAIVLTVLDLDLGDGATLACATIAAVGWLLALLIPHGRSFATMTGRGGELIRLAVGSAGMAAVVAVHAVPVTVGVVVIGVLCAVEFTRPALVPLRLPERVFLGVVFASLAVGSAAFAWGPLSSVISVMMLAFVIAAVGGAFVAHTNVRVAARRSGTPGASQ